MTFMVWESMTKRSPLFGLIAIAWALEKPPVDQSSPHAVPMTAVKFASTVFACLGMSLRIVALGSMSNLLHRPGR